VWGEAVFLYFLRLVLCLRIVKTLARCGLLLFLFFFVIYSTHGVLVYFVA